MKRRLILTAVAVLMLLAAGLPARALDTKLNGVINKMEDLVGQPINKWAMSDTITKEEAIDPNTPLKKFSKKAGTGFFWSGAQKQIWIRSKFVVPEKILNVPVAGTKIWFEANIEDYGEIYVNGQLKQSFNRSSGNIVLTDKAKPGETYNLVMLAQRNPNSPGMLRVLAIRYEVLAPLERIVAGFKEGFGSLGTLLDLSGEKPEKWKGLLDKAADDVDTAALENGQVDKFDASLKKCIATLQPLSKIIKKYSMYMVAYSHIDPAWLWDKNEGENVVWKGTSEQILGLMKDYPRFVYVANQMHCYRWMERDYPALFKKIQAAVKKGEWEPVGAEWVEPDGNLPAGESYVRQFFYGRKYSKEKFGKISTVGWTPDSFGYNWNLPQILKKSDMRGFLTQKISWNDTTKFPYNLFWWEAPDGSKVLVYFPQGGYGESVHGDTMASQLANMKAKHHVNSNLVVFGVGDHGGGVPRDYMDRAFALASDPLYPKMEFISPEKIFDKMIAEDKTAHFPTWDTELYLEYHRGTYTTQAKTKNNNRRNEIRLMNSERFSSIASVALKAKYPFDEIEEAWKTLLFNQFHDILPGSSITPVYMDADKDHAWIGRQTGKVISAAQDAIAAKADTTGDGTALVLFNGLSWQRDDVVETALGAGVTSAAVFDEKGNEVPVQIVTKGDVTSAVFVAKKVPAMGFVVYRIKEGAKSTAKGGALSVSGNTMENEFFKVAVDPATGWVTSIYDKRSNKEIVAGGKAAFQLQAYQELPNSDAWDPRFNAGPDGIKPPADALLPMPDAKKVEISENGPVRVTISAERDFTEKSAFRTKVSLVAGQPIIYGIVDAKWHETNVFLKDAFNLNLDADYATFEIPYATINRVTKPKTAGELAKWEMSGHRWVDYTDKSKDYGVTLLSFSKYGYDVKFNVLRMSLLRCPTGPDPTADRGNHSIPLALYPHKGDWPGADSPLRGAEYNDPVFVVKAAPHKGKLGKRHSFFSAGPDNVVLSTIKKSDDGKGWVIRLVETSGKKTTATITLPAHARIVTETNLVERQLKKLKAPAGTTLKVPIGKYEIKTIKVVF